MVYLMKHEQMTLRAAYDLVLCATYDDAFGVFCSILPENAVVFQSSFSEVLQLSPNTLGLQCTDATCSHLGSRAGRRRLSRSSAAPNVGFMRRLIAYEAELQRSAEGDTAPRLDPRPWVRARGRNRSAYDGISPCHFHHLAFGIWIDFARGMPFPHSPCKAPRAPDPGLRADCGAQARSPPHLPSSCSTTRRACCSRCARTPASSARGRTAWQARPT